MRLCVVYLCDWVSMDKFNKISSYVYYTVFVIMWASFWIEAFGEVGFFKTAMAFLGLHALVVMIITNKTSDYL